METDSRKHRTCNALLIVVLTIFTAAKPIRAGDWPQILGPNRNGIATDEHLADSWPEDTPKKVWEASVGSGFAGPTVVGNRLVLFHRNSNKDYLTAFDSKSGTEIWTTDFPSSFQAAIVDDNGPRATPTIHEGSIYAYSAEGKLYCVDLKSGNKRWERKTHDDFNASGGYFGAGSSPLIEGNFVIVNVGGDKKKAGIVAFDKDSGATRWTSVTDQASYSAPIAVTIEGTRHLLCITRLNFVSLDPQTGKERFQIPFGQRGPTVNAASPVVMGQRVLLTASYGIGARWIELTENSANVIWDDAILSSQYTTPIVDGGVVYGIDGRQDAGSSILKCFDPNTKTELWSKSGIPYATLIAADGKLLVLQTDGKLKVVRLTKSRYDEIGSAALLPGTTRALPALAEGRFYLRNEKKLACYDLSK